LRYPNSETLAAGPSQGAVFETFVIAEFLKQKANLNLDINLYFYRDSNQNEIDLVVESADSSSLYEIKLNSTVQPKHYRQLTRLKDHFQNPSLYLISTYNEKIKLARDLMNIPVWDISTQL
jgi:predicted AAA+ superfamily ATPase